MNGVGKLHQEIGKGGANSIFIISTWHPRFPISIKGASTLSEGSYQFFLFVIIKFQPGGKVDRGRYPSVFFTSESTLLLTGF